MPDGRERGPPEPRVLTPQSRSENSENAKKWPKSLPKIGVFSQKVVQNSRKLDPPRRQKLFFRRCGGDRGLHGGRFPLKGNPGFFGTKGVRRWCLSEKWLYICTHIGFWPPIAQLWTWNRKNPENPKIPKKIRNFGVPRGPHSLFLICTHIGFFAKSPDL